MSLVHLASKISSVDSTPFIKKFSIMLWSDIFFIVQFNSEFICIICSLDIIFIGLLSKIICFIFPVLKLHKVKELVVVKAKCVFIFVKAHCNISLLFSSSSFFSNSNCIFPVDKSYKIGFELL